MFQESIEAFWQWNSMREVSDLSNSSAFTLDFTEIYHVQGPTLKVVDSNLEN